MCVSLQCACSFYASVVNTPENKFSDSLKLMTLSVKGEKRVLTRELKLPGLTKSHETHQQQEVNFTGGDH